MNKVILMVLWYCEVSAMQSNGKVQLNQNDLTNQQNDFVEQLDRIIVNNVQTDNDDAKIISDQVIIWTKEGVLKPRLIQHLINRETSKDVFLCDFPNDNSKQFKIDVKNNKVSVMKIDDQVELKVLCSGKFKQKDFIENKGLVRIVLDQLESEVQRYDGLIKFIALVVTIIGGIITIYKVFIS